jgi:hypothetical protein
MVIEMKKLFKHATFLFPPFRKMNARSCLVIAFLGLLVLSLIGLQPARAYPAEEGFAYTDYGKLFAYVSAIYTDSPINTTYMTNQVSLNFSVKAFVMGGLIDTEMSYSIDNRDNVTVSTISTFVPVESTITYADGTQTSEASQFWSYYLIVGSVDLTDLQSGLHSLTVFGHYSRQSAPDEMGYAKQTIYFTIDNGNSNIMNNTDNANKGSEVELPLKAICASVGCLSLVFAVSYTLFMKHRAKHKITNSSHINV